MDSPLLARITAAAIAAVAVPALASCGSEDEPEPVDSAGTLASISLTGDFDDELTAPATDAARYVVLRDDVASGAPDIAAIRAANPRAEILLYKDAAFTLWTPEGDGFDGEGEPRCPSAPFQGSGVDYCTADANEDWFLHRASDPESRLRSGDYGAQWAMDPGNPGYQDAWIDSVLARLSDADRDGDSSEGIDDRFDGVFIDDLNLRPGHGLGGQGILGMPPANPTLPDGANPAYRAAMGEFATRIAAAMRDDGFLTAANVDADIYDGDDRTAALGVAAVVDVYAQERFLRLYAEDAEDEPEIDLLHGEPATAGSPDWSDTIDFMKEAQDAGAAWLGVSYGRDGDIEEQRFIRASFLLGWDGTEGGALAYRSLDDTPGGPLGLEEWTASVGVPKGPMYESEDGGFVRDFTDGIVVVNPAREGVTTFELGGEYRAPNGACLDSVVLPPLRALIMPACG